jgi:ABC-type branched-subunit amino acid transport system ATPase component
VGRLVLIPLVRAEDPPEVRTDVLIAFAGPILLVEQNVGLALDVATRGYVLESGRIALEGTADELNTNPAIRAAYLGI